MVRIEILAGPEAGRVVEFGPGTYRVGRLKENHLTLPVESVSGRHLEFTVAPDGAVRFRDLGSTNGTFSAGAQIQEGEWFAGSELRLGGCALRLLADGESSMLESAAEETRDAARARDAALAAKRSPLPLFALGVLLLGGGGIAAWWFLLRGGAGDAPSGVVVGAAAVPSVAQDLDLIAGLGGFAEAEAWSLSEGLALREGALVCSVARGRAALLRSFDLDGGGLMLRARSSGARAVAWISFGSDAEAAQVQGVWSSGELAAGAELALPEGTRWFRLALAIEGAGSVSELRVDSLERAATSSTVPPGRLHLDGGNLLLLGSAAPLLCVASAGGAWSAQEGGLHWSGGGNLTVMPGSGLLDDGPAWILADGGPVGMAAGVRVEQSPGLLLGGELRRVMLSHAPAAWSVADGALRLDGVDEASLSWDLTAALTEAARIAREIQTAEREGDDARVLQAAARLLREAPLDEARIQAARDAQRAALERGRARLAELHAAAAGVLFVGALDPVAELALRAGDIAADFAGTPLGDEALALEQLLRGALEAGRAAEQAEADAWRARLLVALRGAYPALTAWVEEQDG